MIWTSLRLTYVSAPLTVMTLAAVGQTVTCKHPGADTFDVVFGEATNLSQLSQDSPAPSHQPPARTALDQTGSHLPAGGPAVCALDLSHFDDGMEDAGEPALAEDSEQIAKRLNTFMSQRF